MWQNISIWDFFAGFGLFMLGMHILEQGLRGLGSRSVRIFLREHTRSPIRGVIAGTAVTAFLQSSSLVGLIVLAFVGAGILEMRNALGIILGSNLGTTFTGWVVTVLGFKLDLGTYANPMLAIGALGTVFLTKETRIHYSSNLLLGLGLLLLGLSYMKGGFASLAEAADVSVFHGHNLFVYFIGGALFTAIIQSSSVSMMIVLSALHSGIFTLSEAAPIIIGADLGTTSTVLLGALQGTSEKRRVALSHFFFNLVTDVLALIFMPLLLYFITRTLAIADPLYSLVIFHSLFNLIGIFIFIPLLDKFIEFLEWIVPKGKEDEMEHCLYISKVPANVTEAAIEAIRKELFNFIIRCIYLNSRCFKLKPDSIFPEDIIDNVINHSSFEDEYALLKRSGGEIIGYSYVAQNQAKDEEDIRELTDLNHAVRNVSYAAKFIKDIRHNLVEFRHSSTEAVIINQQNFYNEIQLIYRKLIQLVINKNPELAIDHFIELKTELRKEYELFIQDIYSVSGKDQIEDEETSSLLNVNRAVYLSTSALLESIRILLDMEEETVQHIAPVITNN